MCDYRTVKIREKECFSKREEAERGSEGLERGKEEPNRIR